MDKPLTPQQKVMLRASEQRLYLEAARRRLRMYLADPASDRSKPEQVMVEVLAMLEMAPAPESVAESSIYKSA